MKKERCECDRGWKKYKVECDHGLPELVCVECFEEYKQELKDGRNNRNKRK